MTNEPKVVLIFCIFEVFTLFIHYLVITFFISIDNILCAIPTKKEKKLVFTSLSSKHVTMVT